MRLAILCGLMAEAQYKREENKAGGCKDENCEGSVWELCGWTGPRSGCIRWTANVVCLDSEYAVYLSAGVGIPKLPLADRSPIRRPNWRNITWM